VATASSTATVLGKSAVVSSKQAITFANSTGRLRRVGWGLGDQALSSLTNFALTVMVAHESAPHAFGLFALLFAAYCVVLGVCRAICSEPLMVRFSEASSDVWRHGVSLATGSALMIGVLSSAIFIVIGVCSGAEYGGLIVIFGLALPGLLLQDTWRYAFSAAGRSRYSFMNDALYAGVLAPLLLILVLEGKTSVSALVAAWGTAALVAAAFGIRQARLLPKSYQALTWWRLQSDLAARYLVEFLALAGECQMVIFGIAVVTNLAGVAAVRGGLLLLGPLNIILYAAMLSAVPEVVRLLGSGQKRMETACVLLSMGLALMTLLWAGLVLLLPSSFGQEIFGSVWSSARPVVLPLALGFAAIGILTGAGVGLRALADAKRSFRARMIVSPVIMMSVLIGALTRGAPGGAWGLAAGQCVAAAVFWVYFLNSTRDPSLRHRAVSSPQLA
jgi:hypothetical protein